MHSAVIRANTVYVHVHSRYSLKLPEKRDSNGYPKHISYLRKKEESLDVLFEKKKKKKIVLSGYI